MLAGSTGAALLAAGIAALASAAPAAQPPLVVYPSATTIAATGSLPPGGASRIALDAAIGEREAAWVVVTGGGPIAVTVDQGTLGSIAVHLAFAHFVAAGSRLVPDALLPWDGSARPAEQPNQPVYVQVEVPYGTKPGSYQGSVRVQAGGAAVAIPLGVKVFPLTLPPPGTANASLLTSFHVSAQSYVAKASQLYGFTSNAQRLAANTALYAFLAGYRISPASWGFGEPKSQAGYASSAKWWLDSAGNMTREATAGPGFSAMRLPISNNRTSQPNYIAKLSPFDPDAWCGYLQAVHAFWEQHGFLRAGVVPYVYALDEPSLDGQKLVARQSSVVHRCFPGGKTLMTGNPSVANAFLWDKKGGDDLDIWAVLSRRWYGRFGHARDYERLIQGAEDRGAAVWSYTYSGVPGSPGFSATEPLSDPRVFLLWNALEAIPGVLYSEGTTSYGKANPFEAIGNGDYVLLYPGPNGPIASARLEQIRDGIEDWEILNAVRLRRGTAVVRRILGAAGLFTADASDVRLACDLACDLESRTKFAWPVYSHDASTPRRIQAAHLAALQLA